jgi:type III restriction enzyme
VGSVVINNPVLNSPFAAPERHFRFVDSEITGDVDRGRRESGYFTPIAQARNRDGQLSLGIVPEKYERNVLVNAIRTRVRVWRESGAAGDLTHVTRRLLEHWTRPERKEGGRPLFFCQIEALETLIFITEAARKAGDTFIESDLQDAARDANPGLFRMATKMATGSGKTVVMAMIIAWHTLNKAANPQDARFTDAFLVVTPGITIRDRLRVLLPNDPENYYDRLDLVPPDLRDGLQRAKVTITNYHSFKLREKVKASKLTKDLLAKDGKPSPALTETVGEMVRRVCRPLGTSKQILVLNDEGHHCYRRRPYADDAPAAPLSADDKAEAKSRDKAAHMWISGLEAITRKVGVKAIHDISATPFFLHGSGYSEGTLFPWVVSDFSLIDAIESGIVKVPRVPIDDNAMVGTMPTFRELWDRIRDDLPKKGRGTQLVTSEPRLPAELEGALRSLYQNYEKRFAKWRDTPPSPDNASDVSPTPPVFIVVCNNTNVSKLVFDWISGYQRTGPAGDDGETPEPGPVIPGNLPHFDNTDRDASGVRIFRQRPTTVLVDSEQLESGEALSPEFKAIAGHEIADFKREYVNRYPGADPEKLTDEDVLREVLNTVGKPGKLGEHIRCVVSVSMLTEGWDANTVTHVLGVRGFRTRLLCEQVVGRALRRTSYRPRPITIDVQGETISFPGYPVEYAEVYGVPFSFIPTSGHVPEVKPKPPPTRVRALEERADLEMVFPRIEGYRYELADAPLVAAFDDESRMAITTRDVPTRIEVAPIVGEAEIHTLDDLRGLRRQTTAFAIARRVMKDYLAPSIQGDQPWRFPELVAIAQSWLASCLTLKDGTFEGLLRITQLEHRAADKVHKAIVRGSAGGAQSKRLIALPSQYNPEGSTRGVDFDTTRPTWKTIAKSHISHVVADTGSWEQKTAQAFEEMDEVVCYAKNHNLHFTIPYLYNGEPKQYTPDFLVWLDDGHGPADPLKLILEVSGIKEGQDKVGDVKAAKVSTARNLWVPAVNALGTQGRWAFLEVSDPWDVARTIRAAFLSRATTTTTTTTSSTAC